MSVNPDIAVLISARKNSKYLAKFLHGLTVRTDRCDFTDVRVMLNAHDTWNDELVQYYSDLPYDRGYVAFFRENLRLGRAGLHEYFNLMVQGGGNHPDWTVYFCEDHFITVPDWDRELRAIVNGDVRSGDSNGHKFPLNPDEIWVIVPKFDNAGAMNHVVSRGFINALGGKIGNHGWIDSYINDLFYTDGELRKRVIRVDQEWFHDFTHDDPSPMSDSHLQGEISERAKQLPKHNSSVYKHRVALDREALLKAIAKETR